MSAAGRPKSSAVFLPGSTLGVLGSGQLGRMFAIAARRLGYRVHTLSPEDDTPTGQLADREVRAEYLDLDLVRDFARGIDVLTFEFENVPVAAAQAAAEFVPVRPGGHVLHATQHRGREKAWLAAHGFPLPAHALVASVLELETALARVSLPAVLKSADFGYDGKGQRLLRRREDAATAWRELGLASGVLEAFVDFAAEGSVIAVRGLDGCMADYGMVENAHAQHILDVTLAPGRFEPRLVREARELAHAVLESLDVVGVLCVELFVTRDGRLLVNELAPRPHNSGHYSFDACLTSQFEQQLRAVCGLPLGSTELLRPAAMVNLLGDLWARGEPDWAAALSLPEVKLHLYGKREPSPGRKMGHLTALAASAEEAATIAREARARLTRAKR